MSGAKFEEQFFNISRYILYSVFYLQTSRCHHFRNFVAKYKNGNIFKTKKDIYSKTESAILLYFEKDFQLCSNHFSCHIPFIAQTTWKNAQMSLVCLSEILKTWFDRSVYHARLFTTFTIKSAVGVLMIESRRLQRLHIFIPISKKRELNQRNINLTNKRRLTYTFSRKWRICKWV